MKQITGPLARGPRPVTGDKSQMARPRKKGWSGPLQCTRKAQASRPAQQRKKGPKALLLTEALPPVSA
jgi:hypothetical protein